MNNLLINSGKSYDPTYRKYYLRRFLGSVPDVVEKYFKYQNPSIKLQGMSLTQMHSHIIKVWQEHYLEKWVSKYFKQHQGVYTPSFCKNITEMNDWECGEYNQEHQSIKGKHLCSCKSKKKKFYSAPDHFVVDKPMKSFRNSKNKGSYPKKIKAYLKCRRTTHKKDLCFICGQKGHWERSVQRRNTSSNLQPFLMKL